MTPAWWPDWSGATLVIVASGPSAAHAPLGLARGRAKVIAINSSIDLVPWADALYACDAGWWDSRDGMRGFRGLRLTASPRAEIWGCHVLDCQQATGDAVLMGRPGTIGWGGNSGFQALNFALQTGPARILLAGFDLHLRAGVHWHPDHPAPLGNPTDSAKLERFREAIEGIAPVAHGAAIEVINCTPGSALRSFPRLDLAEALEIAGRDVAVDQPADRDRDRGGRQDDAEGFHAAHMV